MKLITIHTTYGRRHILSYIYFYIFIYSYKCYIFYNFIYIYFVQYFYLHIMSTMRHYLASLKKEKNLLYLASASLLVQSVEFSNVLYLCQICVVLFQMYECHVLNIFCSWRVNYFDQWLIFYCFQTFQKDLLVFIRMIDESIMNYIRLKLKNQFQS